MEGRLEFWSTVFGTKFPGASILVSFLQEKKKTERRKME
jgi:hypothetical protein